jgi:hypothetical protein
MKLWSEFYDYLLPDVPGCELAMADLRIKMAVRDFAKRTHIWQAAMPAITALANTTEYQFNEPYIEVIKLLSASVNGEHIPASVETDLPGNWRINYTGKKTVFSISQESFFVLPSSTAGAQIVTSCVLMPSMTSINAPDIFFRHVDTIVEHAKYHLMASPDKPYTKENQVQARRENYETYCSNIAWEVHKSHSKAGVRALSQFF